VTAATAAYGCPAPAQRPVDRVIAALHAKGGPVRKVGRETIALCPAHDDHHPSLNVGEAPDGRVLLVCRSRQCEYADIMRALDLDPRDGFADGDRQPAWGPQAVRRHEYRAPDGTVLGWAERQRTERPAKFLPRQPDGSTGSSDRMRATLYNAAALRDRPDELVVLVEGEQDADAVLLHTGALAVTNPNGAGSFTAAHARQLAGRTVQVVLDRDEAGRERLAVLRRAGLWEHCTVRAICEPPPPHKDIAEFLAAGGQVEDMTPVEAPVDPEPTLDEPDPERPESAEQRGHRLIRERLLSARQFLDEWGQSCQPVWGDGSSVAWAAGEALTIVGAQGTGKTTLAGQLVHARLGLSSTVLGMPVAPGRRRVLYLAMDRPRQTARALRRTFGQHRPDGLVVWPGPPLADIAKHPDTLRLLAEAADADTVVVDSVKDAAVGLSDDEVGAGYNRARQALLVAGVELIELHHLVKRTATGGTPRELADVYGSVWITAGSGSVVLLDGKPGDAVVDWRHLKQPVDEVGPWQVLHDHNRGTSEVLGEVDLVEVARRPGGITAHTAAVLLGTVDPDRNAVERARRRLERLAETGRLTRSDSRPPTPTTYTPAGPRALHASTHATLDDGRTHG